MSSKSIKFISDEVCLVTGGAGFIGSHLVRELANQVKKVIAYDIAPNTNYIADCLDKIEYVYGDVADMPHLMSVVADHGVDVIFHLAYMLVPDCDKRTSSAIKANCVGFHNILEVARIAKVRRVVWHSSSSVYGEAAFYPPGPISEDTFVNPTLIYGACKLFNEHIARYYSNHHKLDNIGFRIPVVYGLGKSRLRDISIAHYLVENAIRGKTLKLPPVDYYANWIYVKDVVRADMLAALADPTEHKIFNITGFVHQNSETVSILKGLIPDLSVYQEKDYSLSHPMEAYDYDNRRARDEFGYEPVYSIEEGAKDFIKMIEELGEQYKGALFGFEATPLS